LRDVFRPSGEDSPADHAPSGEDRVPAEAEPNDPQPVPEETPEPLPSPEPSPSPEPEPLALRSVGRLTFDDQLMSAAARPVVALENGVLVIDPEEDDAPPIPFDMTVPEKADYTRHELPFAYASPLAPDAARTSGFGYRLHPIDRVTKFHYGIDLAAAAGTPVYSFAGGRVAATGQNSSYGHYVLVEHAGGYATLYAHLSEITVKAGAEVGMGDRIGRAGQTGKATGPHLHFELRGNGKLIDPAPYL
ncbi:MAG: M23 family metallopeptidase, partial [Oscillospiraceae bacterium]|nr:M23 family metallopeptidase [Oscillospiraceae bacterium]